MLMSIPLTGEEDLIMKISTQLLSETLVSMIGNTFGRKGSEFRLSQNLRLLPPPINTYVHIKC